MHMQGKPGTMQQNPTYTNVTREVASFLEQRVARAREHGIREANIAVDPGIGFGKTTDHNVALLRELDSLHALGHPVLVGVSRKRLIGALTGRPVESRTAGSLALLAWLIQHRVSVARVHDVRASVDAARILAIMMVSEDGEE